MKPVRIGVWHENGPFHEPRKLPGSNELLLAGWYWDDFEDHGGALTPMGPHPSDDAAIADARNTFGEVIVEDRCPDYYTMREIAEKQDEGESL